MSPHARTSPAPAPKTAETPPNPGSESATRAAHHEAARLCGPPFGVSALRVARLAAGTLLCGWTLLAGADPATGPASLPAAGNDARAYGGAEPGGAAAALQKQLAAGSVQLRFDPASGYLGSVLEQLRIPPNSQLLVYSRTSCQRERISPKTPRAVYFNERSYVAYIPGAPLLEVSAADPKLGAVFYSLEQKESARPELVRRDQCLECHTSTKTLSVPGYLVRSYATDRNGVIDITQGCSMIDHRTPLAERWGGWYVCGSTLPLQHNGLLLGGSGANAATVEVDSSKYPQSTSDLVALMVLEHQAHMQNLLTRLHAEATRAAAAGQNAAPDRELLDSFVRYLLFADEAPLTSPIRGTPGFAGWFESQGPRDSKGRSLRQLDLQSRLFKFPCSYMIYSDSYDALPRDLRLRIYHRLGTILSSDGAESGFARLSSDSKRAVLEILKETKADVPIDWKL